MTTKSILEKITARIAAYSQAHPQRLEELDRWRTEVVAPLLDCLDLRCTDWEALMRAINDHDAGLGGELQVFYQRWRDFNGPRIEAEGRVICARPRTVPQVERPSNSDQIESSWASDLGRHDPRGSGRETLLEPSHQTMVSLRPLPAPGSTGCERPPALASRPSFDGPTNPRRSDLALKHQTQAKQRYATATKALATVRRLLPPALTPIGAGPATGPPRQARRRPRRSPRAAARSPGPRRLPREG
jgi:hypothetical protein